MKNRSDLVTRLGADLRPGWVALDLDPAVDPLAWATLETASASAGVDPVEDSVGPEAAALMLAAAARGARHYDVPDANNVHVALAYMPDPVGRVYAVLNAMVFPFEDDTPRTPDDWRSELATLPTIGPPASDMVRLGIGPALRYRRMHGVLDELLDPGQVSDPGASFPVAATDTVVEVLTHVAFPRKVDGYVFVTTVWDQLVLGDEIAAVVDDQVAGLSVSQK